MSGTIYKTLTARRAQRTALAVGMITACLSSTVAPAMAETLFYTAAPTSTFGLPGSGNGQLGNGRAALAVNDATGDVYLAEGNSDRVQVFDAEGNYLSQLNGSEVPGGSFQYPAFSIAVDNSSSPSKGDVYVQDVGSIDVFGQDGKYLRQIGPESFASGGAANVVVDSSGNVWANEYGRGGVAEFDSQGKFITRFPENSPGVIAIDSESGTYIDYGPSHLPGRGYGPGIWKYTVEGKSLKALDASGEARGVAVNEKNHHVFMVLGKSVEQFAAYGAGTELKNEFGEPYTMPMETFGEGEPEEPGIAGASAIAVNDTTGTLYILQEPEIAESSNTVAVFKPQGFLLPTLGVPLPASGITRTTVTLAGALNPMRTPTTYQFEFGTTTSYGAFTPEVSAGKGGKEKTVEQSLKGLTPGTTYHYALIATSPAGSATGPDQTFTTSPARPPTATTAGASNVTLTTATLRGVIDPEGLETSYVLEVGTDTSYGTSISGEAGSSSENVTVDVPVVELAPGTTYHYRFVAVNPDGRVYGQDATFTTPVYEHPIVLPSAEPLLSVPAIAFPAIAERASTHRHAKAPTHKNRHKKHRHKRKKKK